MEIAKYYQHNSQVFDSTAMQALKSNDPKTVREAEGHLIERTQFNEDVNIRVRTYMEWWLSEQPEVHRLGAHALSGTIMNGLEGPAVWRNLEHIPTQLWQEFVFGLDLESGARQEDGPKVNFHQLGFVDNETKGRLIEVALSERNPFPNTQLRDRFVAYLTGSAGGGIPQSGGGGGPHILCREVFKRTPTPPLTRLRPNDPVLRHYRQRRHLYPPRGRRR